MKLISEQRSLLPTILIPGLIIAMVVVVFAKNILGPGSSRSPYIVGAAPGVITKPILNVGDSVNNKVDGTPYKLVGKPDGLGAFDNGDGTFTVLVNHELRRTVGIPRAHGARGAFISKWIIRKDDLSVVHGEDLIQEVATWNPLTSSYNLPGKGLVLNRLCSADLPLQTAFYNPATGLGTTERIFMNGEEVDVVGRAFAHLMDGTSYELPRLGKFSWENSVANPSTGDKTVVVGLDDIAGGQVYIYTGTKSNSGSVVDRAGLTNGRLYGIKVNGFPVEISTSGIPSGTPFTTFDFGDVSAMSGETLESASVANGVTSFQRPEDGAWDPNDPNDFYFATTASFNGNSRLWRLHFNDPANPAVGGTIDMILDGSEGQKMMDNLTITGRRQILIQEDPSNNVYIAKIWRYDINQDSLTLQAQHNPAHFTPGTIGFLTLDEESSGIIEVSDILGDGWLLLNVQAHYDIGDPELVEGGQLLAMHIPPGKK